MNALLLLLSVAIICFFLHVYLLFTSFLHGQVAKRRYFLSHLTLWITGFVTSLITILYNGKDVSVALDTFDTPFKQSSPLLISLCLSAIAHSIVKFIVLPRLRPALKK